MIPIKILCGCGQHYAFDVEPVHGRMPYAVACPACGVDGTNAANEIIQRSTSFVKSTAEVGEVRGQRSEGAAASAPARARVRVVVDTPAVIRVSPTPTGRRRVTKLPGEMDRSQAEHEARAKILWGDAPEEVVRFLMGQGIPVPEASAIVEELFQERTATLRRSGIAKMVGGGLLICVPIVAWYIFNSLGYIYVKLFAFMVIAGFYGVWIGIKGAMMCFDPKAAEGDVAEQ